jgi:hypothetical protein
VSFAAKYTDKQRDAVGRAYVELGVRPWLRVVEMAAAGELEWGGERLPPFELKEETARDFGRRWRKRPGAWERPAGPLEDAPPRDAIETLRRDLVTTAEEMLAEIRALPPAKRNPRRLREIMRCVREAAPLPGPTEPSPPAPGEKRDGHRDGGETRGGPAGALIQAHRESPRMEVEPMELVPEPQPSMVPAAEDLSPEARARAAMAEQVETLRAETEARADAARRELESRAQVVASRRRAESQRAERRRRGRGNPDEDVSAITGAW